MGGVVDAILGLSGGAAYLLVGLLAFGESAAFLGLFVPGEVAVLLGGVVVATGGASLLPMIVVASVAAVAGDSVGYEVGRRFGGRLLAWPRFHRRFGAKADRATEYVAARGGRAVFVGRWTSVLRALVPGLAGMTRMPYVRFLVANLAGGVAWATTFVLAGYLAGASWRQVERVAGEASLVMLLAIVLLALLRWGTRRLADRSEEVRRRLDAVLELRPVAALRGRFADQLAWVAVRFTPGAARGLGWTLSMLGIGGAAWILGAVAQDLIARDELALLDGPVATWFAQHQSDVSLTVARAVAALFGPRWGWWLVALAVVLAWRLLGSAAARQVVVAPDATGGQFPAAATAFTTATVAAVVPTVASRGWQTAIRAAGGGAMVVVVVALSELSAGQARLSGVVGGAALGTMLAMAVEFTSRSVTPTGVGDQDGP
jgi:membrane protein DedA with SNARE-associated domain